MSRLNKALQDAEDAFWASIAASYPEVKTGDLDPAMSVWFSNAAHVAGELWVETNKAADVE